MSPVCFKSIYLVDDFCIFFASCSCSSSLLPSTSTSMSLLSLSLLWEIQTKMCHDKRNCTLSMLHWLAMRTMVIEEHLKKQANNHNIVLIICVLEAVCLLWFLQPTKSYLEASLSADESSSLSLSSVPLSSLLSSSISGGRLSKSFSKGISLSCRSISSSFSLDSDCS